MSETLLRADHLSRTVQDRAGKRSAIVQDVSFDLARGELIAITGPSGSGKSSLLRLLNRLDEPSSGTVWLGGVDYRSIPPRELRRRVGMIMQRAFLFPGTIADNLRYGPRQRHEMLADAKISELLGSVGLGGFEDRDIANLSGGEAQRVAFARALANDPEALLMDEPTSALDEAAKGQVETVIANALRERGIAGVLVTHDLAQAARVAGRIGLLREGRLERMGTPEEVLHAERFRP